MTEDQSESRVSGPEDHPTKGWSRWQIALCVVAGLLVLAGGIGMLMGGDAPTAKNPDLSDVGGASLTGAGSSQTTGDSGDAPWSPAVLGMGFSFFAGLAMGYAIRTFLKLTLIIVGVLLLALYGLDALDLVTIHWDKMDGMFDKVTGGIGKQFESLKTAITGSLPKAGLGILGLYTGLRRG